MVKNEHDEDHPHDSWILTALNPTSCFGVVDLQKGFIVSSLILFLTSFLWFWPYAPDDTAMSTFTFICMGIHASIGIGGFFAAYQVVDIELYGRVAVALWIVVWVFMIVQIGKRNDICEDFCNGKDSCDESQCKDFMYTSRLVTLVVWTIVGGYHHVVVSAYHKEMNGHSRKRLPSKRFSTLQIVEKKKKLHSQSLGAGRPRDLSGIWHSHQGYSFTLCTGYEGEYDVFGAEGELWAHVRYIALLDHEVQLRYADSSPQDKAIVGTLRGNAMEWRDGDKWDLVESHAANHHIGHDSHGQHAGDQEQQPHNNGHSNHEPEHHGHSTHGPEHHGHSTHEPEHHGQDSQHGPEHHGHDVPYPLLNGYWDSHHGYMFYLKHQDRHLYEVFNEDEEMWATLKHHVDINKITLVYAASEHPIVAGHYHNGVLQWNDGDKWTSKGSKHDTHDRSYQYISKSLPRPNRPDPKRIPGPVSKSVPRNLEIPYQQPSFPFQHTPTFPIIHSPQLTPYSDLTSPSSYHQRGH